MSSGALIHVVYDDTGTSGTPINLNVRLRAPGSTAGETKGTVHWGDNSDDRITDDHRVTVEHVYNTPGTYTFAIQIDGDKKIVAGTVAIAPAPQPALCTKVPTSCQQSADGGHTHGCAVDSGNLIRLQCFSGHTHTLTLLSTDLEALCRNGSITRISSVDFGHDHTIVISI